MKYAPDRRSMEAQLVPELIVVAVLIGWARRGSFLRLADARIRYFWLVFLPVGLGIAASAANHATALPPRHWVFGVVHLLGLSAVLVFALANRRIPGVYLIILGAAMNIAALAANGGFMPASREAMIAVGGIDPAKHMQDAVRHVFIDSNTRLPFLCDIVPLARPFALWPSGYSVGDLVQSVGGLIAIIAVMCNPRYSKKPKEA